MTKIITSNCERDFVYKNIINGHRIDGRSPSDGRKIEIAFGKEDGSCIVLQGNTRVLAVVTCEITSPKPSRPAEGALHINLDLSRMAAPNIRPGRVSDNTIEAARQLERCIRDSKCIDLESLCIVAGLKVWCIRVNLQVLNDDGNFVECASIACISALAHFKRPDITVVGTDVTIHSLEDRNPVALSLHHMPVIINLTIFNEGLVILIDPLEIEERIAPGKVIVGVNSHQEICSWHLSGVLMLSREETMKCMKLAVDRAVCTTKLIRSALEDEEVKRKTNKPIGFVALMNSSTILGAKCMIPRGLEYKEINVAEDLRMSDDDIDISDDDEKHRTNPIKPVYSPPGKQRVRKFLQMPKEVVFEGGESRWQMDDHEDESDSSEEEKPVVKKENGDQVITIDDSDESSEEDQKHFLKSHQVDITDNKAVSTRGWYSKNAFL